MTKYSLKQQTGSAHIVIIVVIVLGLLGALGFVFWQNFMKSETTDTPNVSDESPKPSNPKSGVVVLEDGDMNKYVNYENNFEFLLPKQIKARNGCETRNERFDNYGNTVPSESHYGTSVGVNPVIVIESNDEYIIAPDKTVILSSPKGTPEAGYVYKACNVFDTTADLITQSRVDNSKTRSFAIEHRSFKVVSAQDEDAALSIVRDIFNDQTGTVTWKLDSKNPERKTGGFIYTPSPNRVGGFAYKLWYYPAQKKVVYTALGQSAAFQSVDDQKKYYSPGIEETFKFSTN